MKLSRFLYAAKWIAPRSTQIRVRQILARRKRRRVADVWPILPSAGTPPHGWSGWPEGRQFAFVLTHDVETQRGLDRCREIMDLEERFGFRSCFYLVPRRYTTPDSLIREMAHRGFEVGVHGLYHDMTLFRSEKDFRQQAVEINRYMKEWGAVGFRAPYMVKNLEWIRAGLNLQYDTSSFDTDPFEPVPDGAGTVFPFFVDPAVRHSDTPTPPHTRLIELPCTLPQDLNIFVILGEKTADVWKTKLDWTATKGGLVLFDAHPDFMQSGSRLACDEYPLRLYSEFLTHVCTHYAGRYWHALPRDVAAFCQTSPIANQYRASKPVSEMSRVGQKSSGVRNPAPARVIWIDLDNTPHVPFFKPIITELRQRGYVVEVTARDAFQVVDLAAKMGVACRRIGRHYGKNRVMKVLGLFYRALQMAPAALKARPALAVSHGSRSQIIVANLLGIPSVLIEDYEYARFPPLMKPTWRMVPEVIPQESVGADPARVLTYPGIKEDVYVPQFTPDSSILKEIGANEAHILVTVRPPATEAHYHNPESEALFAEVMVRLASEATVRVVLLPRNQRQAEQIRKQWPQFFAEGRVIVPAAALDGLNLIWHSDLVISGGGTMNREAAALGVPVYSTFRGAIGAVDKQLEREGRLILLTGVADVHEKLLIGRRQRRASTAVGGGGSLGRVVEHLENLVRTHGASLLL